MNETHLLNLALQSLCPNSEYTFNDADIDSINWISINENIPTKKQIIDEIKNVRARLIENEKIFIEKRNAILDKLGITQEEAKLLLS